jgi:hypothetical protein
MYTPEPKLSETRDRVEGGGGSKDIKQSLTEDWLWSRSTWVQTSAPSSTDYTTLTKSLVLSEPPFL